MKTIKNFILDTSDSYEEFFEETSLIGIVTSFKSYKFCLQVNKMLRFDFRLNTDIEIILNKKNRKYYFPVYQSDVKHSFIQHFLYDNRNEGELLLPEFKNIDFLWLIKGAPALSEELNDMINIIKSMDGIQLATIIEHANLPNKENLIF